MVDVVVFYHHPFASSLLNLIHNHFVTRWLEFALLLLRSHSFHRHCLGALDTLLLCSIHSLVLI